jgi:hypothetical protein
VISQLLLLPPPHLLLLRVPESLTHCRAPLQASAAAWPRMLLCGSWWPHNPLGPAPKACLLLLPGADIQYTNAPAATAVAAGSSAAHRAQRRVSLSGYTA